MILEDTRFLVRLAGCRELFDQSLFQRVGVNHDGAPTIGCGDQVPERCVERAMRKVLEGAQQRDGEHSLAERVDRPTHEVIEVFVLVHELGCAEG